MIENVVYLDAEHSLVSATIDGIAWSPIRLNGDGEFAGKLTKWMEKGGRPTAYAPPPPERRLVPKSVIVGRLTDDQIAAALEVMTLRQMERWRAPDKPAVYADDPDTLAVLDAIGAKPAVILAHP